MEQLDFTDNEYEVVQSLFRNKYEVYDSKGELLMKGKQKLLKVKEEFPFVDKNGETVVTVKEDALLDIANSYTVYDSSDNPIVSINEDLTIIQESYRLIDPDTEEELGVIKSKNRIHPLLRQIVGGVANLIPRKYQIMDSEGLVIGEINGKLSLKDRYTIEISDEADESLKKYVAISAIVMDALGNQ